MDLFCWMLRSGGGLGWQRRRIEMLDKFHQFASFVAEEAPVRSTVLQNRGHDFFELRLALGAGVAQRGDSFAGHPQQHVIFYPPC